MVLLWFVVGLLTEWDWEGTKERNLKKEHFLSWGVESEFSRSSVGGNAIGIREVKEAAILKNGNYI